MPSSYSHPGLQDGGKGSLLVSGVQDSLRAALPELDGEDGTRQVRGHGFFLHGLASVECMCVHTYTTYIYT